MDPNREFAELVGLCWHKHVSQKFMDDLNYSTCECGNSFPGIKSLYSHIKRKNPNYAADPRLVLREMMKREDWRRFIQNVGGYESAQVNEVGRWEIDAYVYVDLILDTTGKLRDAAIEWIKALRGREEE